MSETRDCSGIEMDLALFVGGELDRHAHARVEEHVLRCPACAGAVDRLAASRAALRAGLEHGDVRVPDLWQGVRARLLESGTIHAPEVSAPIRAPAPRVRAMPRWFPLSAAAAVLFGFGLWMLQPDAPTVRPQLPGAEPVSKGGAQTPVQLVGLRRLAPGESALSNSATSIEALQEEQRLRAALQQPGGAQAASQHRGLH